MHRTPTVACLAALKGHQFRFYQSLTSFLMFFLCLKICADSSTAAKSVKQISSIEFAGEHTDLLSWIPNRQPVDIEACLCFVTLCVLLFRTLPTVPSIVINFSQFSFCSAHFSLVSSQRAVRPPHDAVNRFLRVVETIIRQH